MATILPGQQQGTGNIDTLLLKAFGQEVFTAFEETTEMEGLHTVKTSQKARSISFPVLGKATASYHEPGTEMFGQQTRQTERVITVDRLLVSAVEINDLDETFAHYETRAHYTRQLGRAIALEFDRHIAQVGMLAALDVSEDKDFANKNFDTGVADNDAPTFDEVNIDDQQAGGVATADEIFTWIKQTSQRLDERFVPRDMRFMLLKPADFYTITFAFESNGGGFFLAPKGLDGKSAAMAPRDFVLSGVTLRMSNVMDKVTTAAHFANNTETRKGKRYAATGAAEATGGLTADDPYFNAEFLNVKALTFTPDAVGTLKFKDLAIETFRDVRRQQDFIVAKLAASHGVLNPDSAIVIHAQD